MESMAKRDTQCVTPKLRRNRRIDSRWGLKYHAAVKDAVFGVQALPYMPTEPPPSLSEHVTESEPLYTCKQCCDCFRFRNSYEDHKARRSWILGFWCQHCFLTICTHVPAGSSPCPECTKLDRSRRAYLRGKGLKKSQRYAATRVFYNQCQFFAHLKMHHLSSVDMGDIMLMPLTSDMNVVWSSKLEELCEALIEHAFILRIHILDWLRVENLDRNWWQLLSSDKIDKDNRLAKVLEAYKGRQLFEMNENLQVANELCLEHRILNSTVVCKPKSPDVEIIETSTSPEKTLNNLRTAERPSTSDQSILENEDNPCVLTDIAFVDCGPTPKCFMSESSANANDKKHAAVSVKSDQHTSDSWVSTYNTSNIKKECRSKLNDNFCDDKMVAEKLSKTAKYDPFGMCAWKNYKYLKMSKLHNSTLGNDVTKATSQQAVPNKVVLDKAIKDRLPMLYANNVSVKKRSKICPTKSSKVKQNFQTTVINSNPKILTFQSPKNVDINTIISQISPHLVNSKRIVLIGQDPNGVTVCKQDSLSSKKVQIVTDASRRTCVKNMASKLLSLHGKGIERAKTDIAKSKLLQHPFGNNIVYKNGKKYIIRQSPNVALSDTPILLKSAQKTPQPKTEKKAETISLKKKKVSEDADTASVLQNNASPLTPSPSPSELSSSSCEAQNKHITLSPPATMVVENPKVQTATDSIETTESNSNALLEVLSFHKKVEDNMACVYLNIKLLPQSSIQTTLNACTVPKTSQVITIDFSHLTQAEIKERMEHLKSVHEELEKSTNLPDVKQRNLRSIASITEALEYSLKEREKSSDDPDKDAPNDFGELFNDWEAEVTSEGSSKCLTCCKIVKPKSYVPAFSKPPKDETSYCICYRHVCHECYAYQGNLMRFVAHQNYHRKETPYSCPDCYRRFLSFRQLQVHTWTTCFHVLKRRLFACKVCELEGFRDLESVTRHFTIMHAYRRLACEICYLVLPSYSEYEKHCKQSHSSVFSHDPIKLMVCKPGQCVVRCENYMSHVEKQSGIRKLSWFTCPFCLFSTAENKKVPAVLKAHLFQHHLHSLPELIDIDVLKEILPGDLAKELFKNNSRITNDASHFVDANEFGTIVPKIINTQTITSEVFERGTPAIQSSRDARLSSDKKSIVQDKAVRPSANTKDAETPKIINVTSQVKTSGSINVKRDILPKILDVRSIADFVSDAKLLKKDEKGNSLMKSKEDTEKIQSEIKADFDLSEEVKICSPSASCQTLEKDKEASENDHSISIPDERTNCEKMCRMNSEKVDVISNTEATKDLQKMSSTLKPPPLARIPKHLLYASSITDCNQEMKKRDNRPSVRIAFNKPIAADEKLENFACHVCGDLINTSWPVIRSHFHQKHYPEYKLSIVTPRLLKITPEFISSGYRELFGNRKRKTESNASSASKRRRRWTPKKYSDSRSSNPSGLGLCVTRETAEDEDGNFRCKKCNQCCSDMSDLREHIASNHRIKGRYLICLECGENFVVAPSLQMHLKAFHGIEDPITYMTKNTSYAPDIGDDADGEAKTTVANQCHVCMAVFEDKTAVDKHFRVHGMAFLNRKRIEARNALKSPEQKTKAEEKNAGSPKNVETTAKVPAKRENSTESILDKINAVL